MPNVDEGLLQKIAEAGVKEFDIFRCTVCEDWFSRKENEGATQFWFRVDEDGKWHSQKPICVECLGDVEVGRPEQLVDWVAENFQIKYPSFVQGNRFLEAWVEREQHRMREED